ncbi:TIGR03826 family flagellar region protein [Aquibacillus kalidii]|uniref:TIGR03826 family flagellar region protein n=1 Tax=Aquibacillus kalidii TaxID=2762597 RepID=UPI0016484052|nr:TIGR03826 family flagellar region protein [Aquibacillus kalidii]
MGELSNCSQCNGLFVKTTKDICPNCVKEEEKAFRTVYDFLKIRMNRQATIVEIVEATGVEERLIIKFVKEQRLRPSQFPNLTYPCQRCGSEINEGNLCSDCSKELATDLKNQDVYNDLAKRKAEEEKRKANTYYSIKRQN